MIVAAWNNGKHHCSGAGYGLKVRREDRDKHFDKRWKCVLLKLRGKKGKIDYVAASIDKKSFWDYRCRELTQVDIGIWLRRNTKIPWEKNKPPKLVMENMGGNKFKVELLRGVE